MNKELAQVWRKLDECRSDVAERSVDPWNSKSAQVRRLWEAITEPSQLDALVNWKTSMSPMNPIAERLVEAAIEQSRKRGIQD